jgi:hypothetical protein
MFKCIEGDNAERVLNWPDFRSVMIVSRSALSPRSTATKLPDLNRQKLIRHVCADRGRLENPDGDRISDCCSSAQHGPSGGARSSYGQPANLKFELRSPTVKGKTVNQIVCEGVVVEKNWNPVGSSASAWVPPRL